MESENISIFTELEIIDLISWQTIPILRNNNFQARLLDRDFLQGIV